ncbi:hypothetical protein G6F32_015050 [Rhizopus arrhizus]|nr:hypothetical protein G6F32_015050 [Rhizopus arrhizus]
MCVVIVSGGNECLARRALIRSGSRARQRATHLTGAGLAHRIRSDRERFHGHVADAVRLRRLDEEAQALPLARAWRRTARRGADPLQGLFRQSAIGVRGPVRIRALRARVAGVRAQRNLGQGSSVPPGVSGAQPRSGRRAHLRQRRFGRYRFRGSVGRLAGCPSGRYRRARHSLVQAIRDAGSRLV